MKFQTITVSECCLIRLLLHNLFKKIYLYFSTGNAQPREPALCQLYRHTFVLYKAAVRFQLIWKSCSNQRMQILTTW